MGQISFQQNGNLLLSFQVDEAGSYQLISGDDSWFDPDYVITRGTEQYTRYSNPSAWAQGLKEDYAGSGIEVDMAGFEVEEAPSDFQDLFQEEVLSDAEVYEAETRLGADIKKSERKKNIIKGIIALLIIAGLLFYGWSKIFQDPGPPAGVFLQKTSASLFKGLSNGEGSFEFKASLSGDGKLGTTKLEELPSGLGYKGSFQPGKIRLIPILEPLPEGETYEDINPGNISVRDAEEIIWIDSTIYIRTSSQGWIGSKLKNQFNLLSSLSDLGNALPSNKKGSPQPIDSSAVEILKVRQTFAGPEVNGRPTWELDSPLSSNGVEAESIGGFIDTNKLIESLRVNVVSDQKTFQPSKIEFSLEGDPADWSEALGKLVSIKNFKASIGFTFDWTPPEPIVAPKKVTMVSQKDFLLQTTPDATAITGLSPEVIGNTLQPTAPAGTTGTTGAAPGSANKALEDARKVNP